MISLCATKSMFIRCPGTGVVTTVTNHHDDITTEIHWIRHRHIIWLEFVVHVLHSILNYDNFARFLHKINSVQFQIHRLFDVQTNRRIQNVSKKICFNNDINVARLESSKIKSKYYAFVLFFRRVKIKFELILNITMFSWILHKRGNNIFLQWLTKWHIVISMHLIREEE